MTSQQGTSLPSVVPYDYPHDKYVPIMYVGEGAHGEVYFSLTKEDVASAVQSKSTNTYDSLASKLVAVKVCLDSKDPSFANEVEALQQLESQLQTHNYPRDPFSLVLDHDTYWLATRAIVPSIRLKDLCELPFPRELVLYYFKELVGVLQFMHEVCEPPISHNDLDEYNLLVDVSPVDAMFRPLVLIDFGGGGEENTEDMSATDANWDLLKVLWCFREILDLEDDGDHHPIEGWDEFVGQVTNDHNSLSATGNLLEAMWAKVEPSISPDRLQRIKNHIERLATTKKIPVEAAFREANLLV